MQLKYLPIDPERARQYFEDKIDFTMGPAELKDLIDHGAEPNIIDVRAAEDFDEGHIPGAINLPEEQWPTFRGLSKDLNNIIYCYTHVCHLAARAAAFFATKGYSVMEMEGGFDAWKKYGYESETSKAA